MTADWAGWSTDPVQVDRTRVLNRLLLDEHIVSVPEAIAAAHISRELDPIGLEEMFCGAGLFSSMSPPLGGTIRGLPLQMTSTGHRVATQFKEAGDRRVRGRAARRAVLLWLDDQGADGLTDLESMAGEPHHWFYGTQFTADERSAAARNLDGRGFLKTVTADGGHVLFAMLTSHGTTCAERYDGDPDQMETSMTSSQQFHIGSYTQQGGNSAFGSTVTNQSATTTITIGQTATDLIGLLEAVKALNGIPAADQAEADEISAALQAAASGTQEPAPVVSRARAFFHRLQQFAQPAVGALLGAAGNYAALQLGMPTS